MHCSSTRWYSNVHVHALQKTRKIDRSDRWEKILWHREKKRHFAMSIADSDWNPSPDQPACLIHFGCFYKHLHLSAFCVSQVSLGQDAWQIEAEWIHLNVLNHPKGTERPQVSAHGHETAGRSTVHCNRCLGTSTPVHRRHWLHLLREAPRINPTCGPGDRSVRYDGDDLSDMMV